MGPNSYTPSQLSQWAQQNAPMARPDNYGNLRQSASPRPIVDDFGNRWTGSGRNMRPVMGNPSKLPTPPSPNAATSGIPGAARAAPALATGGMMGFSTSPAALGVAGVAGALYPTALGDGTLYSPEAQAQIARNQAANRYEWVNGDVPALAGSTQFQQKLADAAPKPGLLLPNQPVQPSPSPQPDDARRRQADRVSATGNAVGLPNMSGTADAPFSRLSAAANYPAGDSISNLGDYPAARGLAAQTQGAMLANQGYAPVTDAGSGGIMRQVTPNAGFGADAPNRVTAPGQSAGTTTYRVPGVQGQATFQGLPAQQRGGYMVQDQGNGGTIEGNVARLNSQIEALRGLREARNPGITTGGGSLPSAPTMDMFARQGDSFGDSQMREQQYDSLMKQAGSGRRMTRNQRAAMMESAQGLIAPGLAQIQQQGQMYGQQLDTYGRQQAANQALQQQNQAYALGQQKNLLDAQKWQQQYGLDAAKAEYQAQLQGAQTQEAQARAQGLTNTQQLIRAYQQLSSQSPNDPRLNQLREWIMMSQRMKESQDDPIAQAIAKKMAEAGQ